MGSRTDLGKELRELLGKPNVYFQPPETVKLSFPCFMYSLSNIHSDYADNRNYLGRRRYEIKYITKDPDDELVQQIIDRFGGITFDREYTSENIHHYVFQLYY